MVFWLLGALQIILGVRVVLRLIRSAGGVRIEAVTAPRSERVSIIVPVLNETARIKACLDSLMGQSDAVAEILVVDGGSSDGTQSMVECYQSRDRRVQLIDASPVPWRLDRKSMGSVRGVEKHRCTVKVGSLYRCRCTLLASAWCLPCWPMLNEPEFQLFRLRPASNFPSLGEALLHPSLLTTLVYRLGIPGKSTRNLHQVQANGQCFFSPRDTLLRTNAFRAAQLSLCEDITIARRLAECGEAIGFYESDGLVWVRMYEDWHETWRNWPRSLPIRDQYFGWREAAGLLEVLLVQSLPLPLLFIAYTVGASGWVVAVNLILGLTRLGVLMGIARAYEWRPWTYWFSPLARSSSGTTADHKCSPAPPDMARPSLRAPCRRNFRAHRQIQDRNPIVKHRLATFSP